MKGQMDTRRNKTHRKDKTVWSTTIRSKSWLPENNGWCLRCLPVKMISAVALRMLKMQQCKEQWAHELEVRLNVCWATAVHWLVFSIIFTNGIVDYGQHETIRFSPQTLNNDHIHFNSKTIVKALHYILKLWDKD